MLGELRGARLTRTHVIIAVVLASLAGCGGEDDEGQSAGGSPPPQASPPPPSATNGSPKIGGTPPSHVVVGTQFDFTPTASDPDGDVLTFSAVNAPTWLAFDSRTGRLRGVPGESDLGQHEGIGIRVTDGDATASLPAFSISVVPSAAGVATLTWVPPTERADGTPVDLAGYRVYWGTSSRNYRHAREFGSNVATAVIDNLAPATWHFAVTALDHAGAESEYSNEAIKVIR